MGVVGRALRAASRVVMRTGRAQWRRCEVRAWRLSGVAMVSFESATISRATTPAPRSRERCDRFVATYSRVRRQAVVISGSTYRNTSETHRRDRVPYGALLTQQASTVDGRDYALCRTGGGADRGKCRTGRRGRRGAD